MSRLLLVLGLLFGTVAADAQYIRVRLFEGRGGSSARFISNDAAMVVSVDGTVVATAVPGEVVHVEREGSGLDVSAENVRRSGSSVEIVSDGIVRLRTGRYNRTYRGAFEIGRSSRGLRIVNRVDVEPYVASVVATEYPFREIEGVKAQAVLARTYALRHRGDHTHYDVEDTQRSQVYKGEGVATETTREAALLTTGQVLRYGSDLVEAVYSSSSGGHSANNEDVWNSTPVPYLRGRPDPFDAESPQHRWSTSADASRVHRALSRYGSVNAIYPERSTTGHLRRVRLEPVGRTITGSQFRAAINARLGYRTLLSTNMDVRRSGDRYVFDGGGFGHGVGMSQYGARGRAKAGHPYEDILAHYFPGTALGDVEGGSARPLVAAGSYRTRPIRRADARAGITDSTAFPIPPADPQPPRRQVVEPDRRPAWVVREALPNGDRVRSRPTPRREARDSAPEETTRRRGW
ncbi:MAG: SpoIID/LytB domain-containing protein [Bacteroidota bacterium]